MHCEDPNGTDEPRDEDLGLTVHEFQEQVSHLREHDPGDYLLAIARLIRDD